MLSLQSPWLRSFVNNILTLRSSHHDSQSLMLESVLCQKRNVKRFLSVSVALHSVTQGTGKYGVTRLTNKHSHWLKSYFLSNKKNFLLALRKYLCEYAQSSTSCVHKWTMACRLLRQAGSQVCRSGVTVVNRPCVLRQLPIRLLHYVQGQSPEPKIREYFYYIDHQGQVSLFVCVIVSWLRQCLDLQCPWLLLFCRCLI